MVPQFYPKLQWRGKTRGSWKNMKKHNAKAGGNTGETWLNIGRWAMESSYLNQIHPQP